MMIIKIEIEFIDNTQEELVTMKIRELDEDFAKFINHLKLKDEMILAIKDNQHFRITPSDIFYFEAVENKVFLYTQKDTYEIKDKLYSIEEKYENIGFVRISKSTIVNVEVIESISPEFSGRFELKLTNKENMIVSRSYVKNLKNKLGMDS